MSEAHDGAPEGVTEDADVADLVTEETTQELSGDDAAAATDEEGEATPAKPRRSAQERINEAIRAQRDAERDRDFYREQALRTQQPEPARPAEVATDEGRPDPADFTDGIYDPQYVEALTDWKVEKAIARTAAESANREKATKVQTTFAEREAEARTKHADYDEKVVEGSKRNAWPCTPVMSDAILSSDAGPDVAYHLATNPAEARRIAALEPISQVLEVGKIAQRLATPAKPTAKTATDAPLPTEQVRGVGGRFTVAPDTTDFAAFEKLAAASG